MLLHCSSLPAAFLATQLPFSPLLIVPAGVAFVLFFWLLRRITSALDKPAEGFFQAMARRDLVEARSYFAKCLPPEDERSLRNFLARSAFSNFEKARWRSRSISGDMGRLQGVITMKDGVKIPMQVVLAKENDEWKIRSFDKPEPEARFTVGMDF